MLPELTSALGRLLHPDLGSSIKNMTEVQPTNNVTGGSCGIGCYVRGGPSPGLKPGDGLVLSRPKRQQGTDFADPVSYMDQMIAYLFSVIPGQIEEAVEQSEAEISILLLKKRTQGWSIIVASWKDVVGEWIQNGRTFNNFGGLYTIYNYGFLFWYGWGFGLPLLVGLPKDTLDCGVRDFQKVIREYGLDGPDPVGRLVDSFGVATARSVLSEFDVFMRLSLSCVLDREDETVPAADLSFTIDELSTALNLRLDLEEARSSPAARVKRGTFGEVEASRTVTQGISNKKETQRANKFVAQLETRRKKSGTTAIRALASLSRNSVL